MRGIRTCENRDATPHAIHHKDAIPSIYVHRLRILKLTRPVARRPDRVTILPRSAIYKQLSMLAVQQEHIASTA